ncbi:hypothetical protein RCL1_003899 [Eukaryota sp. TZLM3-RCL]
MYVSIESNDSPLVHSTRPTAVRRKRKNDGSCCGGCMCFSCCFLVFLLVLIAGLVGYALYHFYHVCSGDLPSFENTTHHPVHAIVDMKIILPQADIKFVRKLSTERQITVEVVERTNRKAATPIVTSDLNSVDIIYDPDYFELLRFCHDFSITVYLPTSVSIGTLEIFVGLSSEGAIDFGDDLEVSTLNVAGTNSKIKGKVVTYKGRCKIVSGAGSIKIDYLRAFSHETSSAVLTSGTGDIVIGKATGSLVLGSSYAVSVGLPQSWEGSFDLRSGKTSVELTHPATKVVTYDVNSNDVKKGFIGSKRDSLVAHSSLKKVTVSIEH